MANIESNTLLEKLTQINSIKGRLRRAIIDIGGGDYLTDQSPFAAFPRAISRTFSDIKNTSRLLEYIDLGGVLDDIIAKEDLVYKDVLPYVNDILDSKQRLVDNLRVKGVSASLEESFSDLVGKVLDITEGTPTPGEGNIYSTVVNRDEYTISYDVIFEGISSGIYHITYKVTNLSDTKLSGLIVKDIFTDDGSSNLTNFVDDIGPSEFASLRYSCDAEQYELLINNYSGEVITQFDTKDKMTNIELNADLSKAGYDTDIKAVAIVNSSDYLGCSSMENYFISDTLSEYSTYSLDKGLVSIIINTAEETSDIMFMFGENQDISLGSRFWTSRYRLYNTEDIDYFVVTYDDFGENYSYEHIKNLYDNYKSN